MESRLQPARHAIQQEAMETIECCTWDKHSSQPDLPIH
jgi:hypothetical protein